MALVNETRIKLALACLVGLGGCFLAHKYGPINFSNQQQQQQDWVPGPTPPAAAPITPEPKVEPQPKTQPPSDPKKKPRPNCPN